MTDQERTYMRFNSHLSNDQETEAEFKQRAADWHARMDAETLQGSYTDLVDSLVADIDPRDA